MFHRAVILVTIGMAWGTGRSSAGVYQAKLTGPLSSRQAAGEEFLLRVVGLVEGEAEGRLPRNTLIQGRIKQAFPVGLGVKRERARLDLAFEACLLPEGTPIPCNVELLEIDNAREKVNGGASIRGIVAADHPHSLAGGVWLRPRPTLFGKSALGLTGAAGIVHARLLPNPLAGAAIVGARSMLLRLPDSEIELPECADLIVRVRHPRWKGAAARRENDVEIPDEVLAGRLLAEPHETVQPGGGKPIDIVNLAFLGKEEDLEKAFHAAGWTGAEPLTARTFARTYAAFASMSSFASAPVSPVLHRGRLPERVYQRSFNTIAKRHHIRLWRFPASDDDFWLAAATHDIAIGFDWNRFAVTHRVDPRIDRERNIVINDLADRGCIASMQILDRPELKSDGSGDSPRVSDGGLAVIRLQACEGVLKPKRIKPRRRWPYAATRRIILETRHYATRGNPYYYGYRAARWTTARREAAPAQRGEPQEDPASLEEFWGDLPLSPEALRD